MEDPKRPHIARHPIRFRAAAEFRTRPGYRAGLDPRSHKLAYIVGDYDFSKDEALRCGLDGCHTPHQRGYVVATESGIETHIGNECGRRHFNINWGELQSTFDRAVEERETRAWLESVVIEKPALMERAKSSLAALGALNRKIDEFCDRIGNEPQIARAVVEIVRRDGAVRVEEEIDARTAELMGLNERQRRTLRTVGQVVGTSVLRVVGDGVRPSPGIALVNELRLRSIPHLADLDARRLQSLSARERKAVATQLEQVKYTLQQADAHIAVCERFLAPVNLREFGKMQPPARANERTRRILRHFATLPD